MFVCFGSMSSLLPFVVFITSHTGHNIIIVSRVVCAVVFFAVSYPMAVYFGEWITFKNLLIVIVRYSNLDPDIYVEYYNLDDIIPSIGATAVSCYNNIHHRNLSTKDTVAQGAKLVYYP